MNQKSREIKKELQLTCPTCQNSYQLLEIQQENNKICADNCQKRWQELCHDYHQEKALYYVSQQEEEKEKAAEKSEYPDWLKKTSNSKHEK